MIRPFEESGQLLFQLAEYRGNQVFHKNCEQRETIQHTIELLKNQYKQMEIMTQNMCYSALVSKKGKSTIKKRKNTQVKQINRFLEFVKDVLPALPKDRKITILDFGCGKSYLTFAMYYFLKIMNGYSVQMIGLDLKSDVIRHCNELAQKFGYEDLTFLEGDISSYEGVSQVDMVVTLHACDTATDFALDKAVRWGAKVILSVPCCQHEINQKMENNLLQPVLKYGIIKERVAALFTDAIRANLLEQNGYSVQILEFIDMEHTPKNLLIRAVKNGHRAEKKAYRKLCDEMNLHGTLEQLLEEQEE